MNEKIMGESVFSIVIIGVGGIGLRHLESCLTLNPEQYALHIVDYDEQALLKAQNINQDIKIFAHQSFDTLPHSIDLCVVATQARSRAMIIKEITSQKTVKNFILEKVLFQKLEDYEDIQKIFNALNIQAWVNCPRRMWPAYKALKEILTPYKIKTIEIYGKEWDLGCNAIHYIDLISYLCNVSLYEINNTSFPFPPKESKRKGNYYIDGMMRGIFLEKNCLFKISSLQGEKDFKEIKIDTSEGVTVLAKEFSDKIQIKIENTTDQNKFIELPVPYQSQLTSKVVEEIKTQGTCLLAPYSVSKELHSPFIKTLYNYMSQHFSDLQACPIT
jgi:hypothetical protein